MEFSCGFKCCFVFAAKKPCIISLNNSKIKCLSVIAFDLLLEEITIGWGKLSIEKFLGGR